MSDDPPSPSRTGNPAADATRRRLFFPQLARTIEQEPHETLFQSARRHGVRIVGACGGRGTCGSCEVRIVEGLVEHVSAPVEHASAPVDAQGAACEVAATQPDGADGRWVRACRMRAASDCTIEIAARSLAPIVRTDADAAIAADAPERAPAVDSPVTAREIELDAPSLADPACDADRLLRALEASGGASAAAGTALDLAAARELPQRLREHHWKIRVRLHGDEVIGCAAPHSAELGLAVDLGTTNVAAFLLDLRTGARLAALGIENPQATWGADLISRIHHAARSEAAAEALRRGALEAIAALAHDLCASIDARTDDIVDAAVCGNTAMQHLLLGLPVGPLGRTPFVAVLRDAVDVKARELGLSFCAGARVHVAPSVGGFIGGDHVAALLATRDLWNGAGTTLVMDIGTNTEITLIHDGRFSSASCPSGPALEGGQIRCGMRAAEGAIERVRVDAGGDFALDVIGDAAPIGLCGSGVLAALAAFRDAGIVDASGRLARGHRHVHALGGKAAVRVAPGVLFTQDDVRAVQLAKAAIRAATQLLLERERLAASDIDRIVIAGAFGAYLDVASGVAIGLFPELPRERFVQVGNAAGVGVRSLLASREARARAHALALQCRYVELSTIPAFQKTFLHHIGFDREARTRRTA